MESHEKMYSIKETAALLSVSRDSVVRLIRNGKLRAVHFPLMGGRGACVKRQVKQREIERFLKECEEAGDDPAFPYFTLTSFEDHVFCTAISRFR